MQANPVMAEHLVRARGLLEVRRQLLPPDPQHRPVSEKLAGAIRLLDQAIHMLQVGESVVAPTA